ncbi:hypothetical protein [Streptomyces sp. NA02950]|uniref:hypothetical protein n=1 Tax=Streptomyces sp. NA02950 TaxID=2742137 RepID=UPI0020CB2E50|nr:hypothetical protein [Streptomyces sp. NA02950]
MVYDPTFGDADLAAARRDLVIGRWQGARDLLRATGNDWDHRTHRMRLLAEVAAGNKSAESWLIAQPRTPDAQVLRAETEVMRLFAALAESARRGQEPRPGHDSLPREMLDRAIELCIRAAHTVSADPVPWVSLVSLARLYAHGHRHTQRWWDELRARDPYNREGHHQILRYLSARWHGSHGTMYEFAQESAVGAPDGSPLIVLPQAARVEHYRDLAEAKGRLAVGLTYHWSNEGAQYDLSTALRRWIQVRDVEYAQDVADLNLLAHGLVFADMTSGAREVFRHLGNRPTRLPWAYCGEPAALFARWRDQFVVPDRGLPNHP